MPPPVASLAFLACLAATLYLTGVIWTVQVAHYPLFAKVGPEAFRTYHAAHTGAMGLVVGPAMLAQLGTSALLAFAVPAPPGLPRPLLLLGFALAVGTWGVTGLVSVPLHGKLAGGWDADAGRALVLTNWIRTALWTAHALLLLELTRRLLARAPG
jgi:hypothetical protein